MNGTITIRTTAPEYGMHRAVYDEFVEALEAEGFVVRVDQGMEFRGAVGAAVDVGIWVVTAVGSGIAYDAIKRAAKDTISRPLPGRKRQPVRSLPVYDGEQEVGEITIPPESPEE